MSTMQYAPPETISIGGPGAGGLESRFEAHRAELTAHCYRMLASPFEAEDAVQETFIRAWRGFDRFEGRSTLRSWLYSIATNVCLDMLGGRERRARPMDLGAAQSPEAANLNALPETTWIQPLPNGLIAAAEDPAEMAVARETVKLAFVAALQHLPPRQRAVLILREVLRWQASEVAELLDTSVASVNSALQRARATLDERDLSAIELSTPPDEVDRALLARYVEAFESYDMDALSSLLREDACQWMPPYDLWLQGRADIIAWTVGPGIGCRGSRLLPAPAANGSPAFGQYRPNADGSFSPWALQVLELSAGKVIEIVSFLDTASVFPLFGLPPRLEA
jgi:RNA polymerase sigma-70 factor (ECF subfamily)